MSIVKSKKATKSVVAQSKTSFEFVGRGWVNTAGENSKMSGTEYINIVFDRGIEAINGLDNPELKFHLYPNKKRAGKKDADYRLVVLSPEA
jgi:hypothetical protein